MRLSPTDRAICARALAEALAQWLYTQTTPAPHRITSAELQRQHLGPRPGLVGTLMRNYPALLVRELLHVLFERTGNAAYLEADPQAWLGAVGYTTRDDKGRPAAAVITVKAWPITDWRGS